MKKLINICKLPMLIASSVLVVAFTVLLILGYTMPFGKTYKYCETEEGMTVTTIVKLLDDNKYSMEQSMTIDGEESKGPTREGFYKIEDGKVYIGDTAEELEDLTGKTPMAEVSGYKLVSKEKSPTGEEVTSELLCTANKPVQIISIIGLVVGVLLLAGSVTVIVLDKKGIIKQ